MKLSHIMKTSVILAKIIFSSAYLPSFISVATRSMNSTKATTSLNMSKTTSSKIDEAKKLISNAISIGAPAYNAGNIDECARVYKETALNISNLLPQSLASELNSCIQTEHSNSNEEAWAFRRQFDSIMEYTVPFMPADAEESEKYTYEPFTGNMIPSMPLLVLDNVMGGISEGEWNPKSNTFIGNTSLAYNGGFSSIRWRMKNIQNWSYAKGIYLKVKHSNPDKHTFRLILKDTTCEQIRLSNYKNVFCNPDSDSDGGSSKPILIPFDSFNSIEQMGRAMIGPVFNRSAVTELGLMAIKPTVVGPFELHVQEWGLYM